MRGGKLLHSSMVPTTLHLLPLPLSMQWVDLPLQWRVSVRRGRLWARLRVTSPHPTAPLRGWLPASRVAAGIFFGVLFPASASFPLTLSTSLPARFSVSWLNWVCSRWQTPACTPTNYAAQINASIREEDINSSPSLAVLPGCFTKTASLATPPSFGRDTRYSHPRYDLEATQQLLTGGPKQLLGMLQAF